jgi:hypothetical protein
MKIQDGAGGGKLAGVNDDNRLETQTVTVSETHFASLNKGKTFLWTSSYSAATGNEIIYIKNTSTTSYLIIDKVTVNGVLTGLFELYQVSGTASGTSITGTNANLTSNNVAAATALGNASVTGLTIGNRIDLARISATGRATMELNDVLILGFDDAVAVTYTGSTAIVDATITGYYEDI